MSLFRGDERLPTVLPKYRPGPDQRTAIRPCACGRPVRANRFEPAVGVANHNRSREHKAWRLENGL